MKDARPLGRHERDRMSHFLHLADHVSSGLLAFPPAMLTCERVAAVTDTALVRLLVSAKAPSMILSTVLHVLAVRPLRNG